MKKTIAIIQARIGSTRLPYKMMLSLHDKPIIEWVVRRVKKSKLLDNIVVAIPDCSQDDILEEYLKRLNIDIFRGSEIDVLSRFYFVAKKYKATEIVRVCADNPLIDAKEIDNLIEFYKNNSCDYAYNHIPKDNKYPDGLGAEITSFKNLEYMWHNAKDKKYREHCMSYIIDNPDKFKIKTFNPKKELQYPNIKLDIDRFEDYYKLALKPINIDMSGEEIIEIFKDKK